MSGSFLILTAITRRTRYKLLLTALLAVTGSAESFAQTGREDSLTTVLSEAANDSVRVQTLIALCDEFTYNNPEKALQFFEQARELAESSGNLIGLARSYERAGNVYFHQGKKELSREHYFRALEVNRQVGDYEIDASIFYNLGNLFYETGAFDSSLYYADKAAEVFLANNDSIGFAATRYLSIGTYKDQGLYSLAMQSGIQALGIFQRHGVKNWEIFTLNNLIDLYNIHGNYAESLEMVEKVLQSYRKDNNRKFEAVALRYKGDIFIATEQDGKAQEALSESLDIAREGSFLPEQAKTLISLGLLQHNQKNYNNALTSYREALEICVQTNDAFYESVCHLGAGKSLFHLEKMEEALSGLQLAGETMKHFGDFSYLREIHLYLSRVHEEEGRYRESLQEYKLYSDYRDSLLRAEKSRELGEITAKYENELKEEQIHLLQNEKALVVKNRNNLVIIGLLLIVLAGSSISFLILRVRKNRQLVMKSEEVDQMKSRFFANISHEFRTPISLILSPLYELKRQPHLHIHNPTLRLIEQNAKRLLVLVNQILDLSKLEEGKHTTRIVRDDLYAFLRRVSSSFTSLAESGSTRFRILIPEEPCYFNFDPDKLEIIVNNLLSNAFRHEPRNGEVTMVVTSTEKPSIVRITIKNRGSRIPPDIIPHIFDRFYSGEGSSTGTGIGLALVKELAGLFGGTVKAESSESEGTSLTVDLPEQRVDPSPEPSLPMYSTISEEVMLPNGSPPVKDLQESGKPRVLIIEDHRELREYMQDCLADDYQVVLREEGQAGLEEAVRSIPDIILSDVMMPGMDGLQICRRLKTDENTSHIPVILLSARAGEEGILDGLRALADDYLVKPFRVEELQQRMNNLLRTRRELREKYSKDLLYRNSPDSIQPVEKLFLQKLMNVIEKNISNEDFTVEELSREVGMSRSQLHRKLMALLNMNASNFIRNYRLKRAKELLVNRAGSISEVAYLVGFNSPAYFTKCYREYFGLTPGEQMVAV